MVIFTVFCTWAHTADETGRLQDLLLPLLLAPQVGECVDDDTEDEVQNDDDDDEEEQKVVNHSGCKQRLLDGSFTGETWRKLMNLIEAAHSYIFHRKQNTKQINFARARYRTSLDGLLRMSPTPPPLRSPWFSTVIIHMSRVSHTRSIPSSSSVTQRKTRENRRKRTESDEVIE